MISRWFDGDDQLLEELRQALAIEGSPPEQAEMLMVGYDLVMSETLEAALIHDSATDVVASVRSDAAVARMMAFSLGDVEIEFELADGRIVGHLDPPDDGVMYLEQPTTAGLSVDRVSPDDLGAFEFPLSAPATFRLRFVRDSDARSIATGWVDGPHETFGNR